VPLHARRRVVLRLVAGGAIGAFVAIPAPLSTARAADGPAASLIEKTSIEVIELIKNTTGAQREAGIRKVLETSFDLSYMGQAALGPHWNQTDEAQRVRYLKAATSAEAHAYSERFGQYGGQTLAIGKVFNRPNGVTVVDSRLNQSNGQPIRIEWEVRDSGQSPRITDVKIEGVSMIMTRRSDFNSYIQSHGGKVEPLIQELEARAAR
jgi:phospholipid transport system substrate-binding protein